MITTADAPLPSASNDEIEHVALDEDYVLTAGFVEKVVDAADDGDACACAACWKTCTPPTSPT